MEAGARKRNDVQEQGKMKITVLQTGSTLVSGAVPVPQGYL